MWLKKILLHIKGKLIKNWTAILVYLLSCIARKLKKKIPDINHPITNCVRVKSLSHVWLFATPWTIAHQAPLSMRFPSQEYWSGLPTNYPSSKWGLQKIQASFIIWTLSKFLLTKVNNQSIWIAWDIYRCLGLNKFKETKKCVMQPIDLGHPTPVLLAGKSHRRRILVGCSPWGR